MTVEAKICGLSTKETLNAAINDGVKYVGFVFFPPSPRHIDLKTASELSNMAMGKAIRVGVFVNPDDDLLNKTLDSVDLDIVQLHGTETPDRVSEIKTKFNKQVMKAISVATKNDVIKSIQYENVADLILFDAKAPKDLKDALPGGNGLQFDWRLLANLDISIPWLLSGGLDAENVIDAVEISNANCVDVSSGLETTPGNKDINKIKAFMKAIRD